MSGTSQESQGQHLVNFQLVLAGQFFQKVRDSRVELEESTSEEGVEAEVEGAAKAEMDRRERARVVRENRILICVRIR